MNTLVHGPGEAVLWRGESPKDVCARLYPGNNLVPMIKAKRSTIPFADYCDVFVLDGTPCIIVFALP